MIYKKALVIKVILIFTSIVSMSFPAYGNTTIGRWCDRMIPSMPKFNRTMTIIIDNNGAPVLNSKFNDGSSSKDKLKEDKGGFYIKIGSKHGDKYRVVENSGNLQLLDSDGLIRTAKRLENTPKKGECQ